jgi:hypothetical protein
MTTVATVQPVSDARPLGPLEHFFSLVDQHRSVHFSMAAHIEGQATVSEWRTALDALQRRHPLFSVSIAAGMDGVPRFCTAVNARIPLRIVANPAHAQWIEEMAKELATPFDVGQAPLVRAALLRGIEESILILTAHHSIADGHSVSYAVRDLLRALCGEKLEPSALMPAQESLIDSWLETGGAREPEQAEPAAAGRLVTFRRLDGTLPKIEAIHFTPELTDTLMKRAREERTTVHAALCAALVLAGKELSKDWRTNPVRVLSPFNLRKQIGVGEECGVFVWAGVVPVEPGKCAEFWDLARSIKTSLTARQTPSCVALGMEGLAQALEGDVDVHGASQILANAFPCELLLTNLGNLTSHFHCGELKLRALWGPAVLMGFQGEQTVGVTTTNGSLCMLHTSFAPIPSLTARAASLLRSFCAV